MTKSMFVIKEQKPLLQPKHVKAHHQFALQAIY